MSDTDKTKDNNAAKNQQDKEVKDKGKDKPEHHAAGLKCSSGLFKKTSIVFEKDYGTFGRGGIKLREFTGTNVDGSVVVEAFPSNSFTSLLTAGYLRDQLNLPLIGVMTSPEFPPRAIIESSRPVHAVRIYGDERLVVFLCEFKIPTDPLVYHVAQAVLDFCKRHASSLLVTIEGLPMEREQLQQDDADKLRYISTSKKFCNAMVEWGHIPVDEGVIMGVTGTLLSEGALSPTDVCCLLSPTPKGLPDVKSAVRVVQLLDKYLDQFKVDLGPLEEKALKLQQGISEFLRADKTASQPIQSMYG